MRQANVERMTKETEIRLLLDLDGGEIKIATGIGFFDHMLNSFAVHSGFSIILNAKGDLQVDCHHLVEDVGIVLGQALKEALAGKIGDPAVCGFDDSVWTRRSALPHSTSAAARFLFMTPPCSGALRAITTPA